MNLAMWSGPRNLSTALMRSFGARDDCTVWDEPFYAAYLTRTGLDHPMRAEIIAAGESDYDAVIARCQAPAPNGARLYYQKHMTQHMTPGVDRGWVKACKNVFLIREPHLVMQSYQKKRENPTLDELGFVQQAELFDLVCDLTGEVPPVIDARRVRENPTRVLSALCAQLGLPFQAKMLRWTAGSKSGDGVWAKHWYGAVEHSTGFTPPDPIVENSFASADLDVAQPLYERLLKVAL